MRSLSVPRDDTVEKHLLLRQQQADVKNSDRIANTFRLGFRNRITAHDLWFSFLGELWRKFKHLSYLSTSALNLLQFRLLVDFLFAEKLPVDQRSQRGFLHSGN